MSKNLALLRDEIESNHGGIAGKSALLKTLLNLIVEDLADQYTWNDLQVVDSSLALGTNDYFVALPASLQFIDDPVWLKDSAGNWYEVDTKTPSDFRALDDGTGTPVPENTGLPTDCTFFGRTLYFNFKADKDYTIYLDAHKYPLPMATGTDLPAIANIDWLLIAYGTGALYMHRKQPESAGPWMTMAEYFIANKAAANKPGSPSAKSSKRPKFGI